MCRSSVFLLLLQCECQRYSYTVAAFVISVLGIIGSNTEKSDSYLTGIFVLHCFSAVWNFQSSLVPLNSTIKYLKQEVCHNQQELIQSQKMSVLESGDEFFLLLMVTS